MRISNLSSQHLFTGSTARDIGQAAERANTEWLHGLSEAILLQSDTNQLIAEMIEKWAFDVPRLNTDDVSTDHREEQVSLSSLGGRDTAATFGGGATRKMHIVEFHVPFEGNRNIFSYSPSSRMLSGPHAAVMASDLVIRISSEGKKAEQIKAEFIATVDSINQCLETLRTDFSAAIKNMENSARLIVEDRKVKLMQQANVVADLGFPMKRRADAPSTYRAPEVRRKIAPIPPKAMLGKAQRPEPILDEKEYQHILNVMDNMTKVMERSPSAFKTMGEEDIRMQFLVQLNSQYEGQATGETFNFQGKTDILIRSEGRNIFVAECKVWHGPELFLEAVDQLLRYLSWRDTKTAVVVFSRNKGFSSVLQSIQTAMKTHPHLKSGPLIEGETRFRYLFRNPDDPEREIILTVMAYDVPTD